MKTPEQWTQQFTLEMNLEDAWALEELFRQAQQEAFKEGKAEGITETANRCAVRAAHSYGHTMVGYLSIKEDILDKN
jgi:hypothetical protein